MTDISDLLCPSLNKSLPRQVSSGCEVSIETENVVNGLLSSSNCHQPTINPERMCKFQNSMAHIKAHNSKHPGTQQADLSMLLADEEYLQLRPDSIAAKMFPEMYRQVHRQNPSILLTKAEPPTGLCKNVDWRENGIISRNILDQKSCSGCWAITAAEVAGSNARIKFNLDLNSFTERSAQQLLNCDKSGGKNNGCRGGSVLYTWGNNDDGFLYPYAAAEEYPFEAKDEVCNTTVTSPIQVSTAGNLNYFVYGTKETNYVASDLELCIALQEKPIALNVYDLPFKNYKSGILRNEDYLSEGFNQCSEYVNHAITLVGYNEGIDGAYWIIKNSWGAEWGLEGFAYLAANISQPLRRDRFGCYGTLNMNRLAATPVKIVLAEPITEAPSTKSPSTISPTFIFPGSKSPSTISPSHSPTISPTFTGVPTTISPTTLNPSTTTPTLDSGSIAPSTASPSGLFPVSKNPTSFESVTVSPTSHGHLEHPFMFLLIFLLLWLK